MKLDKTSEVKEFALNKIGELTILGTTRTERKRVEVKSFD